MGDDAPKRARRRRRRPAGRPQGTPAPAPAAEPVPAPPAAAPESEAPSSARRRRSGPPDAGSDRGLRDLVGAGRSQLGVSGALRARDVNRPTDEDLAEAEKDIVLVRRHWKPDEHNSG
jgi:hypothetical protein